MEAQKLFESIAAEYETELSGLDYELNWNHSFNSNQYIMINEPMIRRVFGNLFSNAVRYGEKEELQVYLSGYVQDHDAYFSGRGQRPGSAGSRPGFAVSKVFYGR